MTVSLLHPVDTRAVGDLLEEPLDGDDLFESTFDVVAIAVLHDDLEAPAVRWPVGSGNRGVDGAQSLRDALEHQHSSVEGDDHNPPYVAYQLAPQGFDELVDLRTVCRAKTLPGLGNLLLVPLARVDLALQLDVRSSLVAGDVQTRGPERADDRGVVEVHDVEAVRLQLLERVSGELARENDTFERCPV